MDKIYFYPYGGYTKFNDDLNKSKKEELLILIMGPVFQILFYLLIHNYLTINELTLFKNYHYSILLFNLLPIYPLDGGKLINVVTNYFLSFKKSFKVTFIVSYTCIFTFLLIISLKKLSLSFSFILMIGLIICKLTEEVKKEKYYFNKFLLERFLNNYKFSKIKVIKGINDMSRDYKHVIFNDGKTKSEREYLKKYFRHY